MNEKGVQPNSSPPVACAYLIKLIFFQFVELDGCSLSTAKLVELGQGKLKIKVCLLERNVCFFLNPINMFLPKKRYPKLPLGEQKLRTSLRKPSFYSSHQSI